MRPNMRPLMRVTRLQSLPSRTSQAQRAFFASRGSGSLPGGTPGESWAQAMPIGPYYEAILDKPAAKKPEEPAPKTPPPTTTTTTTTASTKPPARSSTKKPPKSKADAESTTGPSSPSSSSSSSSGTTTISSTTTTTPPTSPPQPTTTDPISSSSSSSSFSSPAAAEEEQGETRSITFSSRLAGPTQRADRLQSLRHAAQRQRGSLVAGVRVPPRPAEPDDCCMSGCVDCVWDRYRDEMEEWAEASARAQEALRAAAAAAADAGTKTTVGGVPVPSSSSSMDDDGGGSEANWRAGEESAENVRPTRRIAKDLWDDDLYTNIPVGIREFMKHEKKLKKKHEEEGTLGG